MSLDTLGGSDEEKIFHQSGNWKWKIFLPLQNVPSHVILVLKYFLEVQNYPLYTFGTRVGAALGPDEEKKILPQWKIFHQKWKSCSTPRASLARAVFKPPFFARNVPPILV